MTADIGQNYWAPNDLEAVNNCPACCASATEYRYKDLLDHLEGVPGQWNFRQCGRCDSLFLDPRPTRSAVGKAYSSESYFTHEPGAKSHAADNGDSVAWRLANGYLNSRFGCSRRPALSAGKWIIPLLVPIRQQLDCFYRHLPNMTGVVLDVGCGNGAFLLRAAEAGWHVQGIEPDPVAAEQAAASGFPVHHGDVMRFTSDKKFDVITLSHVFEHLHDPEAVLSKCRQLLRPGGMLWMAMPNMEGLGHRIYRQAWFPLDPPRHLLLPSRRALKRLCAQAGFTQLEFLRRGRIGASGMRECAARASALGIATGPAWLWNVLISILSVFSPRWSEEFIVVARMDGA